VNFVVFLPEQMRAESVGCYGHPLIATPNMDRLAAEGTRFDQCYVQYPVCGPSRCSLFTGWYPHVNGHRTLWHSLRPHEPNTLKYLKQAGYDVRWWGKNDLFALDSFADSVTRAETPWAKGAWGPMKRTGPDDPLYDSFLAEPFDGGPWETCDAARVKSAIDFLRSGPDKPFVIYLPLLYAHPPYSAPEPWHSMYDPKDLPQRRPAGVPDKPAFHELIRQTRGLDRLNEQTLDKIAAVYLGMISYSDWLLGEFMKVLSETGHDDDTTVFFASDHGDWAGDYGLVEKWHSALDDTLTRVPMVIRTPGGKAGHVVDTPVELFDISATALELAGIEAQHTHFAQSLVPQLHGAVGDADRCAFAEGGYDTHERHCFEDPIKFGWTPEDLYYQKALLQQTHPDSVARSVMVRDATHKLIYRTTGQSELYDMQQDPRELCNIYDKPEAADVRQRLERRLLDFYLHTSDVTPFDEDPRDIPSEGIGQA